ncbi:MAG: hypothetical protein IJY09_04485 [Lachnospiraceae bacterium]|nr:hypothetical protein [Lachnospiraceae bacterium]
MIRFFTWHDIAVAFEKLYANWPKEWSDVKVYSDSVVIYHNSNNEIQELSKRFLKESFTKNYDQNTNRILIDYTAKYLEIYYEEDDAPRKERDFSPFFKNIFFKPQKTEPTSAALPGARILAFHSYKGGVGRTLSLVSFLRECSSKYPEKKILVIDADLEAPGLTWMLDGKCSGAISYLDILSIMNFEDSTNEINPKLVSLLKTSTMKVITDTFQTEHFFLPVYREKSQVMNIFSEPQRILKTQKNKFYVTEFISKLGKAVGAELVLVDLRAGITEYSAPFLFDPRVEKYYITSTSLQSICGTNQLLEQIYNHTTANFLNSRILLTMIPETFEPEQINEIQNALLKNIHIPEIDARKDTYMLDNYIIQFLFDKALVHISNFESLCDTLRGKAITTTISNLVMDFFPSDTDNSFIFKENEARAILQKLHTIARDEVTTEAGSSTNMLATSSLKEIAKSFHDTLPKIVISGAKGSGKTYVYRQLLLSKTWENFVNRIEPSFEKSSTQTVIVPLVSTTNRSKIQDTFFEALDFVNKSFDYAKLSKSFISDTFDYLRDCIDNNNTVTTSAWKTIWTQTMLSAFDNHFHKLSELDEYLQKENKRIIYILDGLEDLFGDAQKSKKESWKSAIRSICQDMINALDNLDCGNIGIIVFARKDMLAEAIEMNYEQFRNQYQRYELNWSQTEALRLSLWLTAKAYPEICDGIDILTATRDVLVQKLTRLWGKKLGKADSKEAFSDRWILAALSDFTGQLQARDIVRFLKYATASYADANLIYPERLIMPVDIRNAMEPCSRDKLNEIQQEMKTIYAILEKFMKMDGTLKSLPLTLDTIALTGEEIVRLEEQGFLKISDKKYYLPEIIRLALGFRYEKGARPKVLALLVQ